jgi:hypothetical protein
MAKKMLVPVFPSDRFYEAVVRAADIINDEGGLIVFVFTKIRPSPDAYAADGDGRPSELDMSMDAGDVDVEDIDKWRDQQIAGLEEARQLLFDRGVRESQIEYVFADDADTEGTAQAIADEAAAGAYDMVILSHGYFENEVNEPGEDNTPQDVARAVAELDGPSLIVA